MVVADAWTTYAPRWLERGVEVSEVDELERATARLLSPTPTATAGALQQLPAPPTAGDGGTARAADVPGRSTGRIRAARARSWTGPRPR